MTAAARETLLAALNIPDSLVSVPRRFFDRAHDPTLAALVVHVGERDSGVVLALNGHAKQWLDGQQHVWVIVFVTNKALAHKILEPPAKLSAGEKTVAGKGSPDEPHTSKTTTPEPSLKPELEVRLEPLDYRAPLSETTLIKGLISIVGKLKEPSESSPTKDVTSTEEVVQLGSKEHPIAYANFKLPLIDNTINRVRVRFGDTLRVYATFANYSESRVGISLALGGSWPAKESAHLQDFRLAPYGLLHLYAVRPHRPPLGHLVRPQSFGFFAGFRLDSDIFRDLAAGVSVGHVWSNFGFMGGWNLRREDDQGHWSTRVIAGVQYGL